jgi:hypothetical protein
MDLIFTYSLKGIVQQELRGVESGSSQTVFLSHELLIFYFNFEGSFLFRLQITNFSSSCQNMRLTHVHRAPDAKN